MTVAFDAKSSVDTTANGATSFTSTNLTVGSGANRALIAAICWSGATPPAGASITWGGTALTLIPGTSVGHTGDNVALYGLLNPASGTLALAGSWTGARDYCVAAASFTGVNQTSIAAAFPNGHTATGTASPSSVAVTSAVGNMAVAAFANDASTYTATSGTNIFIDNVPSLISAAATRDVGAASVTLTGTMGGTGNWAAGGCSVAQVAGAVPNVPVITSATATNSTVNVVGTSDASVTINVSDAAGLLGTTTANGSGAWSYTTPPLADGTYSFTATATNANGTSGVSNAKSATTVDNFAITAVVTPASAPAGTTRNITVTANSGTGVSPFTFNTPTATGITFTPVSGSPGQWTFVY